MTDLQPLPIPITAYDLAKRYIGVKEIVGQEHHPLVVWWLQLAGMGRNQPDEIAWCGAFVHGICWELDLPRPPKGKALRARSWLAVGREIAIEDAIAGFDVVVTARKADPALGHVGLYSGHSKSTVQILGGNQRNEVSIESYDRARLLGVRRLR